MSKGREMEKGFLIGLLLNNVVHLSSSSGPEELRD